MTEGYFKILNEHETKKISDELKEQFGIKEIPGILIKRGEEKIFIFQGALEEAQIRKLREEVHVERVGIYFAKEQNGEIRLSIEGVYILKEQLTKNIFELNEKQAEEWMLGQELPIATGKEGFLIMKHGDYYLGCGKASREKIGNFIPKARRLKYREN